MTKYSIFFTVSGLAGLIREQQAAKAASSCAKRDSDENPKPALTWNTSKPFDPWGAGWIVKSDTGPMVEADNSPFTRLSDTNVSQLQAVHGSAHIALSKGK